MKNVDAQPKKALAALSGGVDSAVAALLALRGGYNLTAAVMDLHPACQGNIDEAGAVAERLGAPFMVFDLAGCFRTRVIDSFADAYEAGNTPNPCVECNKHIKFGAFAEKALETGHELIVTGHYAGIERSPGGRLLLKKGSDASKDQSYMLYSLTQGQLAMAIFPLGNLSKKEVRELAAEAGLQNAQKRESQDICFIPDGDYAAFICAHRGNAPRKGRFIDSDGNILGESKGVYAYTVGQRRGLGLSMPRRAYVLEIRPSDAAVVVGSHEQLFSSTLTARDINLIPVARLDSPIRARVKIRYRQQEQNATVEQIGEDALRVDFDEPQRAIARGQAAVVYDGDTVVGGGTIV